MNPHEIETNIYFKTDLEAFIWFFDILSLTILHYIEERERNWEIRIFDLWRSLWILFFFFDWGLLSRCFINCKLVSFLLQFLLLLISLVFTRFFMMRFDKFSQQILELPELLLQYRNSINLFRFIFSMNHFDILNHLHFLRYWLLSLNLLLSNCRHSFNFSNFFLFFQ